MNLTKEEENELLLWLDEIAKESLEAFDQEYYDCETSGEYQERMDK